MFCASYIFVVVGSSVIATLVGGGQEKPPHGDKNHH